MNIPNTLTLARIVLVPFIVWLIISHEMAAAFVLFMLAGFSDAADGYLAKRFGWHTELGAYLDPIADKALLVSIYVTLGFAGQSAGLARDRRGQPRHPHHRRLHPVMDAVAPGHRLSAARQQGQYAFPDRARRARARELGLGLGLDQFVAVFIWVTGALTIVSAAAYFWEWLKHMASYEPEPAPLPARKSHRAPIKTGERSRVRAS